jgi:hypothetical protein
MIKKQRLPSIKWSPISSRSAGSWNRRENRTGTASGTRVFGVELLMVVAFALLAGCSKGEKHVDFVPPGESNGPGVDKPAGGGDTPILTVIKLDGLYFADDEEGVRHYLRFTDKEVWIETSKEDTTAVASWIGGEQSRTPKRAQYALDGTRLTIDNRLLSLTGELRDDAMHASVVPPNAMSEDTVERIARVYRFQALETLPPVTEQSRHLADCFAQYQEFLAFTSKPPSPAQAKPLFDALEALAKWIEMTPTERQRLTQPPHVQKSPIGKLRGYSQFHLTPAGRLPLPLILENHERFKTVVLRIIKTQFEHDRDASFFVEWLIQTTPPALAAIVLRELIDVAPKNEFGASQLENGLGAIPLRLIPDGQSILVELGDSESAEFRQLANRLREGSGKPPITPVAGPNRSTKTAASNVAVSRTQQIPLREISTLKGGLSAPLTESQIKERYGAAVVSVQAEKATFGGWMVGTSGHVLTCYKAAKSAPLHVVCDINGGLVSMRATILRFDKDSRLALLAVKPPAVLPTPTLANRSDAEDKSHWVIGPPNRNRTITQLRIEDGGGTLPIDSTSPLLAGLPVFSSQGHVVGMIASSEDAGSIEVISLQAILTQLVGWSEVKGPDGALLRTWTDNTGQFRVTAQLISVDANEVTLERRDSGARITVELDRLSESDQHLIKLISAR